MRDRASPRAILTALALLSGACTSFDLVRPPTREASLYPTAQTRQGVAIAVDVISNPERVKRYFGVDLLEAGILPIQLVASNRGERRVALRPSDVLLLRGTEVVDPVPLERVTAIPKAQGFVTAETSRQIDAFFGSIALRDAVLAPGQVDQGVLFFQTPPREKGGSRYFRIASLFPRTTLWLRLEATDLDSGERIAFGPFGIAP
jgi:hypothetical protein